jgi:molecular chaperone GrpE
MNKEQEKKKTKDIKEELEKYKKLSEKYLDNWKRERASFLNYKKEGVERIESLTEYVKTGMILELLPVLDHFNLAEKEIPEELQKNENVKGLLQIKKQIEDFLKSKGVTEIECLEEEFDPHFHDVIESVEKEGESGTIIEVVQKGYKVGDKLLRPAKVKVIK